VLLAVAIVVALVLKGFVAQAFYIPSASMEPQLRAGDRVVVSRLAYRLHDPRRGDIVVFPSPGERPADADDALPVRLLHDALEATGLRKPAETELIKRVVGLPGETVEARGGVVHIDGQPLVEPYLPAGLITADFSPVLVPDAHVWVMGDNRASSLDSRFFGAVDRDAIVGRAIVRAWPPARWAFL
jgi:signal peptidase I